MPDNVHTTSCSFFQLNHLEVIELATGLPKKCKNVYIIVYVCCTHECIVFTVGQKLLKPSGKTKQKK